MSRAQRMRNPIEVQSRTGASVAVMASRMMPIGGMMATSISESGTRVALMSAPAKQMAAIFSWSVCRIVGTGWTVAVWCLDLVG